jgi:hypothetical protein
MIPHITMKRDGIFVLTFTTSTTAYWKIALDIVLEQRAFCGRL